jgi:hypothetical protein
MLHAHAKRLFYPFHLNAAHCHMLPLPGKHAVFFKKWPATSKWKPYDGPTPGSTTSVSQKRFPNIPDAAKGGQGGKLQIPLDATQPESKLKSLAS